MGGEIAAKWASETQYPLNDGHDLISVSQYLAVKYDSIWPKRKLLDEYIRPATPPDFKEHNEPHRVLADLPLSLYMTTNYDDFMFRALSQHRMRQPQRAECQWNEVAKNVTTRLDDGQDTNIANPLVFHLHGYSEPEYLVLTEDDYLRFLSQMAQRPDILPQRITEALEGSSLLFIGYSLRDWNFRMLFENLRATFEYKSIAVMPAPGETDEERERAMKYLNQYYKKALDLDIYWGTAREFCAELKNRWDEYAE